MENDSLIQVDVRSVLQGKLGSKARFVPDFAVRLLERVICQDEINSMMRVHCHRQGAEFCESVLADLGVNAVITNPEMLPPVERRRLIIVCNHPLGGLDGMTLIREFSRIYGSDLRFIVNDILMVIKPLGNVFLPINKHGRQDRQAISDINEVMASDVPVIIFPAGLVSRRGEKGEIRDLKWNKMFINKAIEYKRDVLPIHFSGHNSSFFYKFAQWRKRLGLKFNIEMVCLPRELFKSRNKTFTVTIGKLLPWQTLRGGSSEALSQAQEIRSLVYSLNSSQS